MRAQPTASHYVNGRYIDDEQAPLPVIYPATGETIAILQRRQTCWSSPSRLPALRNRRGHD
jgi:hypothetical protein